jgi:phytoene synthase
MTYLCAAIVRRRDPDRYVAGLLLPPAARAGLWALYAFNYEIARTREVVTDAPLGRIRLQWWRDALDEALRAENPQFRHEILDPLADAVRTHNLPPAMLYALIDAREADMAPAAVTGVTGLEDYALATNLPLLHLSALICGENPDDPALIHAAAAYGLVGLLRAHAAHTAQGGHITDSAAVAARAGSLLAGKGGGGVAGVFARIARLYYRRLMAGRGPEAPAFLLFRLLFGAQ